MTGFAVSPDPAILVRLLRAARGASQDEHWRCGLDARRGELLCWSLLPTGAQIVTPGGTLGDSQGALSRMALEVQDNPVVIHLHVAVMLGHFRRLRRLWYTGTASRRSELIAQCPFR